MPPDPRETTAAAAAEGSATPICADCIRRGHAITAMVAYVGRRLDETETASLWWECPVCQATEGPVIVPQAFMLARSVRRIAIDRIEAPELPIVYYSADDDWIKIWLDPADGRSPILLSQGPLDRADPNRARAALDFLAGGDARRVEPELPDPALPTS